MIDSVLAKVAAIGNLINFYPKVSKIFYMFWLKTNANIFPHFGDVTSADFFYTAQMFHRGRHIFKRTHLMSSANVLMKVRGWYKKAFNVAARREVMQLTLC